MKEEALLIFYITDCCTDACILICIFNEFIYYLLEYNVTILRKKNILLDWCITYIGMTLSYSVIRCVAYRVYCLRLFMPYYFTNMINYRTKQVLYLLAYSCITTVVGQLMTDMPS